MHFVDRHRGSEPILFRATLHPPLVLPSVVIQAHHDRAGLGPQFGIKSVGIAFEDGQVRGPRTYFVFVDCPFTQARHKNLPHARWTAISAWDACAHPID